MYANPSRLRGITQYAPYTVTVAQGSTASMNMSEAAEEVVPGDAPLVTTTAVKTYRLADIESILGLVKPITLHNSKRDQLYVSHDEAIRYFALNVVITNVSEKNANARGFYSASQLKEHCKRCGIPTEPSYNKAQLANILRDWYETNKEEIEAEIERNREKKTSAVVEDAAFEDNIAANF